MEKQGMTEKEFRLVFDTIPKQFDAYRPRYCSELFRRLIESASLKPKARVPELGPGTGKATEPILDTGCDYTAIELGANFCDLMRKKYAGYPNFKIINDDFLTHDFGSARFDLVYSAATIQWMPADEAFTKIFSLLEPGGTLAMLRTRTDYKTPNEELYNQIQKVYSEHFKPEIAYSDRGFKYENAVNYGFSDVIREEFHTRRIMNADDYAAYCGTHCDHIVIPEPHKSALLNGIKSAVKQAGDSITLEDTHDLYMARKGERDSSK